MELELTEILYKAVQLNASDVHLTAGFFPAVRVDGKITPLSEYPVLTLDMTQRLVYSVMSEKHRKELEETLHTNTAISTITRIIDVFPPSQQEQIRIQLSFVLQGVISQRLIPKIGGGRVLAYELFIPNTAIRNLIRENKLQQVYSLMQSGQAETGMQTMNQALVSLYKKGLITLEDAYRYSPDIKELERLVLMI